MVQLYLLGGANVSSIEGTLAPPDKYDWTCAFFGPPKSTPNRKSIGSAVFCTAHDTVSSGTLSPPGKYDWTCASLGPPESTTQTANWSFQPFLYSVRHKSLYFTTGAPSPKLPLPMGDQDLHLIHGSLGPLESSTQHHLDQFIHFCRAHYSDGETDRQTDRHLVCNNRTHQCM